MYIPNLADAKRWNDSDERWTLIVDEFAAEANEAIYAHTVGQNPERLIYDAGYERVDDIEEAFVALLQEAGISVRDILPFEHKALRD